MTLNVEKVVAEKLGYFFNFSVTAQNKKLPINESPNRRKLSQ
jgi:hypothetical protein